MLNGTREMGLQYEPAQAFHDPLLKYAIRGSTLVVGRVIPWLNSLKFSS